MDLLEKAKIIATKLENAGASQCLIVGGYVRDKHLGIASKDLDMEVYGLGYDAIVSALQGFNVDLVGKSFGVVKVDNEIDISIPRRESRNGVGHKDFDVFPDPTMTPYEAAARRDFTINSMAMDMNGFIYDPFNGTTDLDYRILRATSERFVDDPLRVLRGMQFVSRFGLRVDEGTVAKCKSMANEFQYLSSERVLGEWQKWALKSKLPGAGLVYLDNVGWLVNFPALYAMKDCPQDPSWHPEGPVLEHVQLTCDAMLEISNRRGFNDEQKTIAMTAALCHDLGKPPTTAKNEKGRWVAKNHADVGVQITKDFLNSMKAPMWLVDAVCPLVSEHMAHIDLMRSDLPPTPRVIRRLSSRLSPANITLWAAVCEADHSGRHPIPPDNPVAHWEKLALELSVQDTSPKPILMGRHLLDMGYSPSPMFGKILKMAFEAQLDGKFDALPDAIEWVKESVKESKID